MKSGKRYLTKMAINTTLTFKKSHTYQIEAVLNSHSITPLHALSSAPSDYSSSTPSNFIVGESITLLQEHNIPSKQTQTVYCCAKSKTTIMVYVVQGILT